MDIVAQHFRPEFVNRIDDVVVFHSLGFDELHRITRIQADYLRRRLTARDLGFALSESAVNKLAEVGFDPVYGAHPLKRAIQALIENPLAQEILQGRFAPGDTILVDTAGGNLVFKKVTEKKRQSVA